MEVNHVGTPTSRKKALTFPDENKRDNENLKRDLNNAMDERDQLKLMLEDIRSEFTAETRLREYLGKMRNTVLKVLSNEKENANVRIQESLEILSSLHTPLDETLQTTGDFLTDLSYSDQETIYGCIPTSAQRKKILYRAIQDKSTPKIIEPSPSCSLAIPLPWKGRPRPGSSNLPLPNLKRLLKQDGDTPAHANKSNSTFCSRRADSKVSQNNSTNRGNNTDQFNFKVPPIKKPHYMKKRLSGESENKSSEHTDSAEVKKEVAEEKESSCRREEQKVEEVKKEWPGTPIPKTLLRNPCTPKPEDDHTNGKTFVEKTPIGSRDGKGESTKSRTHKPTPGKFFQGESSKQSFDTEVQLLVTPKIKPKKHRFLLWLNRNPDMCDYCKTRVFESQFVRRCSGCGLMVHARQCEFEGQCPASLN